MTVARRASIAWLLLLLAGFMPGQQAQAAKGTTSRPTIGLIIDDLGDRLEDGRRAVSLPGAVTCAILPQTTFSRRLAVLAHAAGKEVMLHQPMQALNGKAMGPGGMSMAMSQNELVKTLEANLASVPYAQGVNNHMGSLLTQHPGDMAWFMAALHAHGGLFFVDSVTTSQSVARRIAAEYRIPNLRRNIFLDHTRDPRLILHQFVRLIEEAHRVGSALAIGHPYPETLAFLQKVLPHLSDFGVELVPVSELISRSDKRSEQLWQASLSPSQQGVKN